MPTFIEIPFKKIVFDARSCVSTVSTQSGYLSPFTRTGIDALAREAYLLVVKDRQVFRVIGRSVRWQALLSVGVAPDQLVSCVVLDKRDESALLSTQFIDAVLWPALEFRFKPSTSRYLKAQMDAFKKEQADFLKRAGSWRQGRGHISTGFIEQQVMGRSDGTVNRSMKKR